jgi:hypothetical protein
VYDNTVVHNSINGNGLSGVTVHSHSPGQYLNGNVVRYNVIGANNIDGDTDFPVADRQTTGPASVVGAHHNKFQHVTVPVSKN